MHLIPCHPEKASPTKNPALAVGAGWAMRPPFFLFVLPKRKNAPRPVEERKGRSWSTVFWASPSARGRLRFSAAAELAKTAVVSLEAAIAPRRIPGKSKRGSQAPFGRLNEGGSREGEKTKSSPPWCRFLWYLSFGQAKERFAPSRGEILRFAKP